MKRQRHWLTRLLNTFLVILALVVVVHLTCLTQVSVGSVSFAPSLQLGDHLVVYRWAYGVRLPWQNLNGTTTTFFARMAECGHWIWAHRPNDVERPIARRDYTLGVVQALSGDTLWVDTTKRAVYLSRQDGTLPLEVPTPQRAVRLRPWNIHLLAYTLQHHEAHEVAYINDSTLEVSGRACHEVVFQQPYYWVGMPHAKATRGVNDTIDSYHYGFLPHSHIMGRALFVSYNVSDSTGFNWERVCRALPQ